jgi:transcriptional regulator with XRE-family HTH domain
MRVTWMQELGDRIREAREEKGLSQEQLAAEVEVTRATILHYERGQVNKPLLEIVTKISTVLKKNFEVRGCIIGNERLPQREPIPEQFCLPFDQERAFSNALVKIRPQRGRLILTAEIPA